ncbi:MAG: bifunctional oligoribonuclease/PAP phosphatase NrnA [Candidatus Moraniibacteriota bacterium]|nr:MAG: bifunctional oligoribonuclease/PAP phosphatase NrnA [Candidatus Moranbacteria bacterium]
MNTFSSEFRTLSYIIKKSPSFLLFAHTRPDADTVGATVAFAEFLRCQGKEVSLACFDPFPPQLTALLSETPETFLHPDQLDISRYGAIIACDSVDRGFDRVLARVARRQVTVIMDHHPDIAVPSDLEIVDARYSSTCELLYTYFEKIGAECNKKIATALLTGIIFDTGNFQHICTTPRVMDIAGVLMKRGAPLDRIVNAIFTNKSIPALRLWGKAFERSVLNEKNGMLVTAVTKQDVEECQASVEDIYHVTSILSTVPEAKFAMVLSEQDDETVRASLRSMEQHNVDVSEIAHRFGGGGHRLASGFEIPGKIMRAENGWAVV